jgi:putative transposase
MFRPPPLRLVMIWNERYPRRVTFLTNLMPLSAGTIAAIYKARCQIELLFKALKQYLKIKTFASGLIRMRGRGCFS